MSDIFLGIVLFTLIVMSLILMVMAARSFILQQVEVTITINEDQKIQSLSGQKLLNALHDNNILIPSACAGAGTCGLCRVIVPNRGEGVLPIEEANLGRSELRKGVRLACQVVIRGDMDVKVPQDLFDVKSWECRVISTISLTPFIREIVLELPTGATPHLRAGGYMQVSAPPHKVSFADFNIPQEYEDIWRQKNLRGLTSECKHEITRAYSLANRTSDHGKIIFNVRLALPPPTIKGAPPGIVSSYLFSLKVGDIVKIEGPYGEFGATQTQSEMIFIGGGVGMAPLRAIIHDQLERKKTKRKISYWYGARSRIELFYESEFNSLQSEYENFTWKVALSEPRPQDNWQGATGFIHEVVYKSYLKQHSRPQDCEYYLCGPPLMIKAVLAMLEDIGVSKQNIFNDDFGGADNDFES